MKFSRLKPALGLALLAALPFLPLLLRPNSLLVWPGVDISDLVTAHLPASEFIHHALVKWGQIPLWNPSILSGMPTLGDPLHGMAYPPLWLTYLAPTSAMYHILLWLHLTWAGVGIYQLAVKEGLSNRAAWLSGAAITLSPRLMGQMGLGHATLIFAFCWTPWLLLILHQSVAGLISQTAVPWRWFTLAGGVAGIIIAADPRWGPAAGILALGYLIILLLGHGRALRWRSLLPAGLSTLLAGMGSLAFAVLPMLVLLQRSQRSNLNLVQVQLGAMPPAALLQLLVPNPGGWPEWGAAVAAGVFILAAVGLVAGRKVWFWLAVTFFGALMSLGASTPLWPIFTKGIPGLDLLRIPARWYLLVTLAVPLLAGHGLERISHSQNMAERRRINLILVGAGALVAFLAAARLLVLGSVANAAGQAAAAVILVSIAYAWLAITGNRSSLFFSAIVVLELVLLSVIGLHSRQLTSMVPQQVLSPLPAEPGSARVLSTTFALTQYQAAQANLEMANGVHPLQLNTYRGYMAQALGFSSDEYSVTLPPLAEDGTMSAEFTQIKPAALSLLNIGYVLAEEQSQIGGMKLVKQVGDYALYELEAARPRAWVEQGDSNWVPAEILRWTPNRIEISAPGPGRLVLSEIDYPIWSLKVDGVEQVIEPYEGLLRSVPLPAGEHHIEFHATLGIALWGAIISLFTWLAIAWLWRPR